MVKWVFADEYFQRKAIEGVSAGLTLDELASSLGLSKGALYNYRCAHQDFDLALFEASQKIGGNIRRVYGKEVPPYKNAEFRQRIIDDILKQGGCLESDLLAVAAKHNLTVTHFWRWLSLDSDWRAIFEAALMTVRDPGLDHGRYSAYGEHRCKCLECRSSVKRTS